MKNQRVTLSRALLLWIGAGGAVLPNIGCESSESGQGHGSSFSRVDSAGITILTTPGESAQAFLGWTIDSVPDVVIGAGADEGDQLYRVQGIKGFEDGSFLVVDGGSRQLRFFDAQGGPTHRVGRKGEGPGEFEDPILVPLVGLDSLLVWDRYLQRFQYFSPDGQSNHTLRLVDRWPAGGRPPHGAVGSRMLLDEWEIDWFVPASQQTHGPKDTGVNFLWYDPVSQSQVHLASHRVTRDFHFTRSGRPPVRDQIPFTVFPTGTVAQDGGLITDGITYQIKEYSLAGEVRRILRLDLPGRPVTDAMIRDWMESEMTSRNGGALLQEVLGSMPMPYTLPAFESLLMDDLGFVWAKIYDWDPVQPQRWVVFDPDGAALGSVEIPLGLEVKWIGPEAVLGVWKDEFGVEHVHRHGLRRE